MKEALFYQRDGDVVNCTLCWQRCTIKPGRRGKCGIRENRQGKLYTLVYGKVVAEQIDPVEKKPLFHFLPGTLTYSIATTGCNFHCRHCQNSSISQPGSELENYPYRQQTAADIVRTATEKGCDSISYTYVEPTVYFEFAYDCSILAKAAGLKNIFVSNGYMSREVAVKLAGVLDGINIDIKAFSDSFYREICGAAAGLEPVLENVRFFREQGVWIEVTTLLIPGLNDSTEEISSIADFIVSVDPDIVWHISAFRPAYRLLDRPPTTAAQLQKAMDIGYRSGVRHIYAGNVHGGDGENTICPECRQLLIERRGFQVLENRMSGDNCPSCGAQIPGRWRNV